MVSIGVEIPTIFYKEGESRSPEETVQWEERTASIKGDNNEVLFEQTDCKFPVGFSQFAVDIVASKYFYGDPSGCGFRENSFMQLVKRVAEYISYRGDTMGYFKKDDSKKFCNELQYVLLHQMAAFNSPVWFNVGVDSYVNTPSGSVPNWYYDYGESRPKHPSSDYQYPQGSACFIQSVDDSIESIMDLAKSEALLFKYGSGTGTDLSPIRSCREKLSGGGVPSGPVSFMRIYDQVAGVVKSGGKTRRAAKMQSMKVSHPDIMEFITLKTTEEKKARALVAAGYSSEEAYGSVMFQNANLSVRLSDDFMRAVQNDENWTTTWVTDNSKSGPTYRAREIMRAIAECTHTCGDPGVQFDDTINRYHTCKADGRINASNPCVTGDTLVATKDGMVPIIDLVGKETEVYGSDGLLHPISGAFKTGTKKVYRLSTDVGYSIKATADHRFLMSKGDDKELKDIKVGDLVSVNPAPSANEVEKKYTVRKARVVKIEELGEEDVYDLTEPVTHHFVGNCFVIHNCSEYMFLDNSACNLASVNLMKFVHGDGFDLKGFADVCKLMLIAQDILVDACSYPTAKICENSHKYRPLGLGYSNLGAVLMLLGHPYDSDAAREFCASVTATMQLAALEQSMDMASILGPFNRYAVNKGHVERYVADLLDRVRSHRVTIHKPLDELDLMDKLGRYGLRNAQLTVLAPTGTISFMMDCDTTGIEPDIALRKFKKLVGGGTLQIVNRIVPKALARLGYSKEERAAIEKYVEANGGIDGAPGIKPEHVAIFDCAFPSPVGTHRCISWSAHLKMMAAAQPFISGAISKTVNMANSATVEDIEQAYMDAWKMGLKAVAIYRDGSKGAQPLSTGSSTEKSTEVVEEAAKETVVYKTRRERLPDTRNSVTHKFKIGQHEGYVTAGLYPDGRVGEVFITMSKEGSTIGGLVDCLSTAISMGLQYGVPLASYIKKFAYTRFEPMGYTNNPKIMTAKSPIDYIMRWLDMVFLNGKDEDVDVNVTYDLTTVQEGNVGMVPMKADAPKHTMTANEQYAEFQSDAPLCDNCGSVTVRSGNCYLCYNCGKSMGCS